MSKLGRLVSRVRRHVPVGEAGVGASPIPARERIANAHVAELRRRWPDEPSLEHPVSQLCTVGQFRPPYHDLCHAFGEPPRVHRKQWEFAYILQALQKNGMFRGETRGLGFGVGREPLAGAMAARGCNIVATDMDPNDAGEWARTDQYGGGVDALWRSELVTYQDFVQRVSFRVADMRNVPTDLADFDFCWSSCALEHLGDLGAGLDFIRRSLECLKPGGIAVHTTEFNLGSPDDTITEGQTVVYRERDITALRDGLIAEGYRMELNLNPGYHVLDDYIDTIDDEELHTRCKIFHDVPSTSIGLVIQNPSA